MSNKTTKKSIIYVLRKYTLSLSVNFLMSQKYDNVERYLKIKRNFRKISLNFLSFHLLLVINSVILGIIKKLLV